MMADTHPISRVDDFDRLNYIIKTNWWRMGPNARHYWTRKLQDMACDLLSECLDELAVLERDNDIDYSWQPKMRSAAERHQVRPVPRSVTARHV